MSTRGSSSLSLPCGHFLKWVLLLLLLTVLKPLSAECHVIMDQSSEIVLDTPKVNKKDSRKNCLQDTQFSLNVRLLWWKKKCVSFAVGRTLFKVKSSLLKGHLKIWWPFKEIPSFDTLHVRMCVQYQVQICWESLFFVTIDCGLFKFMSVEFLAYLVKKRSVHDSFGLIYFCIWSQK